MPSFVVPTSGWFLKLICGEAANRGFGSWRHDNRWQRHEMLAVWPRRWYLSLGVAADAEQQHSWGENFDAGVEHVAGDMFESVPKGDAIFMKWILHDWSDDYCLKLLKNCHKAIPENGKVIVVEAILPETPDTSVAAKSILQMDLIMMTQDPGGKERTQQEFLALAIEAGFAGIILECFACNFWVMEFYK
ncbi:Cathecol O-methyltransferase 1 [Sarracenia purpurea var. burkii]